MVIPAALPRAMPDVHQWSDEQLMAGYCEGKAECFNALHQRYQRRIWFWIRRVFSDEHTIEEVSQDVWHNVIRARGEFTVSRHFRAWLCRVTYNAAKNRRYHERRRSRVFQLKERRREDYEESTSDPILIDTRHAAADCMLIARDRVSILQQVLEQLPATHRQALHMHHVEELDYSTVAQQLAVSTPAIASLLRSARQTLRRKLQIHADFR